MSLNKTAIGIICLVAGLFVFSIQDLIIKLISGDYPFYEVMLIRAVCAVPFLLVLAHFDGGLHRLLSSGIARMTWRGTFTFFALLSFYIGLAQLPQPTALALYFTTPLFITILSALILSERVGALSWAAVIAGLIGVIILVRPGSSLFEAAALLPVLSALLYAVAMIMARRMGGRETAAALTFWSNIVIIVACLVMTGVLGSGAFADESSKSMGFLTRGWINPVAWDLFLVCACGLLWTTSMWLLNHAYTTAEASAVAPFEYSGIIWAVIWGWVFFNHWPDGQSWIGMMVIATAGVFVLWQERRRERVSLGPNVSH